MRGKESMSKTYLDRLPPEILYEVFSYFSCDEIVQSFYSISTYMDSVLLKYDGYCLDFSRDNIHKAEFDVISLRIRPSQIIGLKLGRTKFNLFDQYLEHPNNAQPFTRLRSLWLDQTISFNESFLQSMSARIDWNHLHSFRFERSDDRLFEEVSDYTLDNLSHLAGCSSKTFRQLSTDIPEKTKFLHMFFDSIDDLTDLVSPNANQLYSLGVGIQCQAHDLDQLCSLFKNYPWTKLVQFNLNLQGLENVAFQTMKNLLSSMWRLKYLTLIFSQQVIAQHNNLCNGLQWKTFISNTLIHLKQFDLNIPVAEPSEDLVNFYLNTFQSSWWINEKKWFVEFVHEENAFVTVPYFATKTFDNSIIDWFDCMRRPALFHSNIREMKIKVNGSNNQYPAHFCNVSRLSLSGHLARNILINIRRMINVQKIEHLQISSTIESFDELAEILQNMTNLSSLHIQCVDTLRLFQRISSPLVSVRRLVLSNYAKTRILLFDRAHFLFPALIHLTIDYQSRQIVRDVLNDFGQLEDLHFLLKRHDHVPNHRWIQQHTRLLKYSFQSQVFNVNHEERTFIIWINREKTINQCTHRHHHHRCPIQ